MQDAPRFDLVADRGLVLLQPLTFLGYNFTSGTFRVQVRAIPDGTGTPLISLTTVTSGAQGVRLLYGGSATVAAHITAGRLPTTIYSYINPTTGVFYVSTDTVTLSQIQLQIDNSAWTGFPYPAERGDNWVGAWDILITPSGAAEQKFAYGKFTVRGTVTQ